VFDHKAFATDGLYPGLTSTLSVATRGALIDIVRVFVRKTIQATTDFYNKLVGRDTVKNIDANTSVYAKINSGTTQTNITAFTTETNTGATTNKRRSMTASTQSTNVSATQTNKKITAK
jgi:hypothetical protein